MDKYERLKIAAHGLEKLDKMHQEFLAELRKHQGQVTNPVGSMHVEDDSVSLSSLGISLTLKHRPIAIDGNPKAIEYQVIAEHGPDQLMVYKFYLQPTYRLSRDADSESTLCDYNNNRIENILVYEVAEHLLASPIFKPAE